MSSASETRIKMAQVSLTDQNMSGDKKKAWEESSDFANYFCTYAYLYHQKQMLEDQSRMQGYYDAIMKNAECFKNKIVLDVGTGSGILSIWAAQAGAKKVYAIEATDVAKHARKLIAANKQDHIIEVIQSKMEDVELPEKVDIIISEWMGYFLLRESMLDSVLVARDKWLKPGGALYPSHATMFIGAVQCDAYCAKKQSEYMTCMDDWVGFAEGMKSQWGVDISCVNTEFRKEHEEFYLRSSSFVEFGEDTVISDIEEIKIIDILTCTLEEIKTVSCAFEMTFSRMCRFGGFLGWFDVDFQGSPTNPTELNVNLSTSPFVPTTHWGQQLFALHPPQQVCQGDKVSGEINILRRKENQRLLNCQFNYQLARVDEGGKKGASLSTVFKME